MKDKGIKIKKIEIEEIENATIISIEYNDFGIKKFSYQNNIPAKEISKSIDDVINKVIKKPELF